MPNAPLILARHGNTFEASDKAVWVGARTDLPLTTAGEAQSQKLATYIAKQYHAPLADIIAGPLKRTKRMAEIVAAHVKQPFSIDDRLREIDYGLWEGLSSDEITVRFGSVLLEQWERHNHWPETMQWLPSLPDLQKTLAAFLDEQHTKCASGASPLVITSNGILRIIHGLITYPEAGLAAKVKTGHVCVLQPEEKGWRIVAWDVAPG